MVLTLFSCKKEELELPWKLHYSSPGNTLSAITSTSTGEILAVGGDSWYRGISVESSGGSKTWNEDSVCNKQLFGLTKLDEKIWTLGIDGYYFERDEDPDWTFYRLGYWDILRDAVPVNENKVIAVGGVAFEEGVIHHIQYGGIRQIYRFEHELRWIRRLSEDSYLVGGYGLVLKSDNGGYNWQELDIKGDFFTDAHFVNGSTGYIVGYAGTVWKTRDAGKSWEKMRRQDLIAPLPGFQAIWFFDEDTGIIAGENGHILMTSDGGNNWKAVKGPPRNIDWYDITGLDGTAWLSGSRGNIIELSLP